MLARVGSYNIAGGKGPEDIARLKRVVGKIVSLDCDVLGLVEVRASPRSIRRDPSRQLIRAAQAHGYHACYGVAVGEDSLIDRTVGACAYQGNMILSRWPISRYHSFLISDFTAYGGHRETEPRHLLVALIDLPDASSLYFCVTHLHTSRFRNKPETAEVRKKQCERILGIVRDLPASSTTPILLVGDFNNNPYLNRPTNREPEIDLLLTELNDLSASSGPTRIRFVGRSQRPVRIDRVFGNPLIRLLGTSIDDDPIDRSTKMFMKHGKPLSDHRPVGCDRRA